MNMGFRNEHIVAKTIKESTIKELIIKHLVEMGHTFNNNCAQNLIKDGNSIKAVFDVEDPKNPAKKVQNVKKKEAEQIIAKHFGVSLNDTEISIDSY